MTTNKDKYEGPCRSCGIETAKWYHERDMQRNIVYTRCRSCYMREIRTPAYKEKQREISKRRIQFRDPSDSTIHVYTTPERMLTGYCSKCSNNIHDGSCKQTQSHHLWYNPEHPFEGRIEICASCHAKITMSKRPPVPRDPNTGRFIQNN